jgi:hypothetical protein
MSWLSRASGPLRRCATRMVPAARRDWIEAVWAEAPEVPPGLRRLAWCAGGVHLMTREVLMRRRIGTALLFAAGAALAAWAAWPGSPSYLADSGHRTQVIAMVAVLAGLPLLARWRFGPAARSRTARGLRIGAYTAILALIPGRNVIDQFLDTRPRGGLELRVYHLVDQGASSGLWARGIAIIVIMALYAGVILWMTSQRSRVAPATLITGTTAGIAAGVIVYTVAPLGLSKAATNPWLPGSDIDPLVLLAWAVTLLAPAVAAVLAHKRYPSAGGTPSRSDARARQAVAAGVLTNLVSALVVTVLGTGTTALMLKAAWVRNWLYSGSHQLFGVVGLRSLVQGNWPAISYSHEITGSVDTSVFIVICIAFPLIALALTGMSALDLGEPATRLDNPPSDGGGGPPGPDPGPAPPPPGGARLPGLTDDTGPAVALLGLPAPGPVTEKDRILVG